MTITEAREGEKAFYEAEVPFGRVADMVHGILSSLYALSAATSISRLKSWQKFGFWDGCPVGKGKRGHYGREAVERAALMAEFSNLGIPPQIGAAMVRTHQAQVFGRAAEGKLAYLCREGSKSGFVLDAPQLAEWVRQALEVHP